MNTEYVLFNLREAAEELTKAIEAVGTADEPGFEARLVFTYRKLNRAWNARNLSLEQIKMEQGSEFEVRCRFPDEISDLVADK